MPEVLDQIRQGARETARQLGVDFYRNAMTERRTLSQAIERLDPTDTLPESERGSNAFERLLGVLQIRTFPDEATGEPPSLWEDCVNTPAKRTAMVEWWRIQYNEARRLPDPLREALAAVSERAILLSGDAALGSLAQPWAQDTTLRASRLGPPVPLDRIVARRTGINTDGYRSIYLLDALGTDGYRMKRVAQGAEIPTTTLVTAEHTMRIHKYGRAIRATYEQLRRQRIDRIAFLIQRIAVQADADKFTDALNVVVVGDGNSNTASTVSTLTSLDAGASAGTLTLKGWLAFQSLFFPMYRPDVVLGQSASMLQLLLLPVNTVNGLPLFMVTGGGAPGGLTPLTAGQFANNVAWGITSDAPALKLVAFDSGITLEMVEEIGGNVSETERFITNQTQILTLTEVNGFGIIDPNASRTLNINA